jgi:hypothetical protein
MEEDLNALSRLSEGTDTQPSNSSENSETQLACGAECSDSDRSNASAECTNATQTPSASLEWALPRGRGRPFFSGQSGNPKGRPKGSRNRVTLAVEALIEGKAEELAGKALELALEGDPTLIRALLSTVVPPRRDRTVEFELPKIESTADALAASSAILAACADGSLTPSEAHQLMGLLATHVRTVEVADLEARLAALEKEQQP